MSIVTYKCDVCKRTVDLQRNIFGLETPNRCVITHGCRGKLYFEELLVDHTRSKSPEDVIGLDNWQQRRVLFDYDQAIERNKWTIEHNLGNSVSISVYVNKPTQDDPDNTEEIEPDDIIIISSDIIQLNFSRPYAGKAQLVARASDPQLLQPKIVAPAEVVLAQQLSNLGEITIATRETNTLVDIELTYSTTQETTLVHEYVDIDDQPSINSPWSNVNRVIINGAAYIVRSFNGIFGDIPGIVGNGSTFRFTGIDGNPIAKNELFLLLASEPFTPTDKITTQVIDVTEVTEILNPFAFAYDSGEFFADKITEQTIYPPVREA